MTIRHVTCWLGRILLVAAMLAPLSCGEDDPVVPPPPPASSYQDLSAKWHVLNNIEVSHNKRNISKYDELLDDNFTFFLSPGDVGGSIPDQWGRADELLYNSRIFDVNYTGDHRCRSIQMTLSIPDDKNTIHWVEITPASAPTETWWTATVFYSFRFDTVPDTQFESASGAKAEFTIRNAGTDSSPKWRLVEMRDLARQ